MMNNKTLKAGVKMAKRYYETEASGNVNLKSIKKIAATVLIEFLLVVSLTVHLQ